MKIKPAGMAILAVAVILGGIGLAQLAGLWQATSTGGGGGGGGGGRNRQVIIPGDYEPDDIRGSFTLEPAFEPAIWKNYSKPQVSILATARSNFLSPIIKIYPMKSMQHPSYP